MLEGQCKGLGPTPGDHWDHKSHCYKQVFLILIFYLSSLESHLLITLKKKNQLTHLECFTLRPRIGITGENQMNTHRGIKIFLSQIEGVAESGAPLTSPLSFLLLLLSLQLLTFPPELLLLLPSSLLGHLQLEPLPSLLLLLPLSFFLTSLFPQAEKTHKQVREMAETLQCPYRTSCASGEGFAGCSSQTASHAETPFPREA